MPIQSQGVAGLIGGIAVLIAILTWWSIVTPLLAILILGIGWPALHRVPRDVAQRADTEPECRSPRPETNTLRPDVGNHAEARR